MVEQSVASARQASIRLDTVTATWGESGKIRDQVKKMADAITSSSGEQRRSLQQINSAVSQLSGVTQNVAAQAEESAAASTALSARADSLGRTAERVRALGVRGDASATSPL